MRLRTVPPFVTVHMFCASRDIRNLQYFSMVYDYVEKADLSKGYQNPKRNWE